MTHFSTAEQGDWVSKLRFHPSRPLLASVGGRRAEVCIWRWDDAGTMECLARIDRETELPLDDPPLGSLRAIEDVAWHPHEDWLALVGGGRPIELWSQGCLLKTLGKPPESGRRRRLQIGYSAVAFSATADRLVASRFGGGSSGSATEIYEVATGALIGSFWRTDTTLALHPEGEIVATLSSNQMASPIRFVRLADALHTYDVALVADADGYSRLLFSPAGDALAIVGHAYAFGVKLYQFPECQRIFQWDLESWEEIWKTFWARHRRNEPDRDRSDEERPPYDFIRKLPPGKDRIAFSPDGRRLLIGATLGGVVELDAKTGEPVDAHDVSNGPVVALDASPSLPVLATADADGRIKLWRLDGRRATVDRANQPITAAFLEAYSPIDPRTPEDGFRTTDGNRWYNFETIGEQELDDDAPPWAQIAKSLSQYKKKGGSDEPSGEGADPASD